MIGFTVASDKFLTLNNLANLLARGTGADVEHHDFRHPVGRPVLILSLLTIRTYALTTLAKVHIVYAVGGNPEAARVRASTWRRSAQVCS